MSMSSKTTNNYFGVGIGTDDFSLYDFNDNFEKCDELIKALKDKDTTTDGVIEDLQTTINTIRSTMQSINESNSTNINQIANITNLVNQFSDKVTKIEDSNNLFTDSITMENTPSVLYDTSDCYIVRKNGRIDIDFYGISYSDFLAKVKPIINNNTPKSPFMSVPTIIKAGNKFFTGYFVYAIGQYCDLKYYHASSSADLTPSTESIIFGKISYILE